MSIEHLQILAIQKKLKKLTNDGAPENERKKLRIQIKELEEKDIKNQQEKHQINTLI